MNVKQQDSADQYLETLVKLKRDADRSQVQDDAPWGVDFLPRPLVVALQGKGWYLSVDWATYVVFRWSNPETWARPAEADITIRLTPEGTVTEVALKLGEGEDDKVYRTWNGLVKALQRHGLLGQTATGSWRNTPASRQTRQEGQEPVWRALGTAEHQEPHRDRPECVRNVCRLVCGVERTPGKEDPQPCILDREHHSSVPHLDYAGAKSEAAAAGGITVPVFVRAARALHQKPPSPTPVGAYTLDRMVGYYPRSVEISTHNMLHRLARILRGDFIGPVEIKEAEPYLFNEEEGIIKITLSNGQKFKIRVEVDRA